MGKAKIATRKELEEVIAEMIQELNALRTGLTNIGNYFNLYLEWKGDKIEFPRWLTDRIEKAQTKDRKTGAKGDNKSEKRDRYKKITQPL